MIRHFVSAAITLLLISGCGAGEPPEEHVWQEQADAVDRAGNVEDQMLRDAEERRKKMEAQGG